MSNTDLTEQSVATQKSWVRFSENREREWGLHGVDTGIHDLNLAIGGLLPGDVTTIAGRSGHGKTALLTPMFATAARYTDVKPEFCVFTWEMEASKLVDRIVTYETGFTSKNLVIGARLLSDEDVQSIKEALEKCKELPVKYQQTSITPEEVTNIFNEFCKNCEELEKEDGIKRLPVGVVDYVGLAKYDGSGIRTYGISEFYSLLKQSANSNNASWVVLAQINRGADDKEMPDRGDLADSQSIENNSDNLVIISRPEYQQKPFMRHPLTGDNIPSDKKMLFRVLKCRQFGPSEFVTSCDIARNRFWSLDHDKNYHYWELYENEKFWKSYFGF